MPTDLTSQSDADWQLAQKRYNDALNAGYDEKTAASLYLAPVDAKWKIIQSNPDAFDNADSLNAINSDFNDAQSSAVKAVSAGADPISLSAVENKYATRQKAESAAQQLADLRLAKMQNPPEPKSLKQKADIAIAVTQYKNLVENGGSPEDIAAAAAQLEQVSGTAPEAASSTASAPPMDATSALNPGSGAFGGITMPPPMPFADKLNQIVAQAGAHAADALTKKPVIYITGGKNNTVDRAGADAAWLQAHPTTAAPSNGSAADALSQAENALPDFSGQPAPSVNGNVVSYKKGSKPVKGQAYSIGTDKNIYVWNGKNFEAQ